MSTFLNPNHDAERHFLTLVRRRCLPRACCGDVVDGHAVGVLHWLSFGNSIAERIDGPSGAVETRETNQTATALSFRCVPPFSSYDGIFPNVAPVTNRQPTLPRKVEHEPSELFEWNTKRLSLQHEISLFCTAFFRGTHLTRGV
jgi:hypothetical protein